MPVRIIAHRTCPLHAPENSLAGLRKAEELAADAVEVDVRRSFEGVPVLMHDASLWRTTRVPLPVRLLPASLLRRLRLRGSDEHVPTLEEALAALPERLALAIEVKDASVGQRALRLVHERGLEARVEVWSYQEAVLRYFAREAPTVPRVLLRDDSDPEGLRRYLEDATRLEANGISPHWRAVTPQLVGEARDRGLRVEPMNRDMETVAKKAAAGIDGVVTDNPREVRALVEHAARPLPPVRVEP